MVPEETSQEPVLETPLERAGRGDALADTTRAQDAREEREADTVVADIDAYVAETDPASLPEAEAALNAWEIPADPRGFGVTGETAEPLVSVFAAQTEAEAAIVRGVLEAQGIPTTLDGLPTGILGNVFQAGEDRWGDILVPAGQAEEAQAILSTASTESSQTPS